MTLKDMVLDYERHLILAALAALHEKMKRLGISTAASPRPLESE